MANSALTILLNARDEAAWAFKKVSREVAQMERATQKASRGLSSMSNKLMLATAPLLALGVAATKMAMDAVESENLFEVSMGDMAGAARDFSEAVREQLGLNGYEIRRQVGTWNTMLGSMGMAKQASFEMAKGLTMLANDMASFFNLRPEEAFEKLQAGITGEIEPLKRLGIIVSETTVKEWALTHGLIKQGQEMSEAQKVMARYAVIMEQTKNAQGDLARTIESPANQLRIFKGQLTETAVEVGQVFLPVLSGALNWINQTGMPAARKGVDDLKESWTEMSDHAKTKMVIVGGLFLAGGPLLKGISVGIRAVGLLATAFASLPKVVKTAIGLSVAGLVLFHEQIASIATGIASLMEALARGYEFMRGFGAQATGLRNAASALRGFAKDLQDPGQALRGVAEDVVSLTMPAFDALTDQVQALGKGFFDTGKLTREQRRLMSEEGVTAGMAAVKTHDAGTAAAFAAEQFKLLPPALANTKTKAKDAADALKAAGITMQEVVMATVRFHPATARAAAGVRYWNQRIEAVNLALIAHQDQMRAAQAELSRMSERLSELNKQLGEQQRRLSELSKPQLAGMGAMGVQIGAIQDALKRLNLAELMGKPFAEILAQYPLLTKGAMQYLGTLPQTREGLEAALKQLQALEDVQFDEKLRLIAEAAGESQNELSFDQALTSIAATKSAITSLTGQISSQEQAIRNQQNAIQAMQGAADAMNRTLVEFQAQLRQAEANQQLVTQALQLAFTWLIQDREKMQEMGAEGVAQSEIVDEATRALLTAIDLYATGVKDSVSGNLEGVVRAYEDALRRAQIIVSQMPAIPSVSVPVSVGEMPFAGSFAGGGVVPGPAGAPAWAIVHGGEPIGRAAGGGNTYVTVNVGGFVTAERDLAETIRRELILVKNRNVTTGL